MSSSYYEVKPSRPVRSVAREMEECFTRYYRRRGFQVNVIAFDLLYVETIIQVRRNGRVFQPGRLKKAVIAYSRIRKAMKGKGEGRETQPSDRSLDGDMKHCSPKVWQPSRFVFTDWPYRMKVVGVSESKTFSSPCLRPRSPQQSRRNLKSCVALSLNSCPRSASEETRTAIIICSAPITREYNLSNPSSSAYFSGIPSSRRFCGQ
jgi:hypothetical protein